MRRIIFFTLFCFFSIASYAQIKREISGYIIDKLKREPLEYINILVDGTTKGAVSDSTGYFIIKDIPAGIYKLQVSALGYKTLITPEYILSSKNLSITIELEESSTELKEVNVTAPVFRKIAETPVGLRIIGLQEIEKSPGANRDISRIVQGYPGVAFSPAGYRNDLIVRGGGPSENRFYMDGVEIPNINHFSTQGASGGPVGIINADFLREVNFNTGVFPASRGNALSSVMDLRLRDGDIEKNSVKATIGASELSLASDGHINKKTSYLVSVRRSYLQFLFDALGLPFLPSFTDAQFKIKHRFSARHELSLLGIAGIDNMELTKKTPKTEDRKYILGYLPEINQETFTLGAVYKYYAGKNIQTVVISHNFLNNRNTKYLNNNHESDDNLTLRLKSIEQDSRIRFENLTNLEHFKINAGVNLDYSQYTNNTFQRLFLADKRIINYNTDLGFLRWGVFGTATYESPDERFTGSIALRTDAADYSETTRKFYNQISPRLSLSYRIAGEIYFSAATGQYYQLPPSTALGFKINDRLINENLKFMSVNQSSVGLSYRKGERLQVSTELFYKNYDQMPLSVKDGIPLACKGNDYGVVGNEELTSTAQGRSYGAEFLVQWQIPGKLNLASSATLFKSEYRSDKNSSYVPSSWDSRYLLNLRGTYNFKNNWSYGMKINWIGNSPFTPYDLEKSSLIDAWDVQGKPYYDYGRFNTERLKAFMQIDVRVDKTFYIKKNCMLGFYLDIQNISNSKYREQDILMSTGQVDPSDPTRYVMKYIKNESGTILPTLGITFEF